MIVFYLFRLYRMIWTLVGLRELLRVVPAVLIAILGGVVLDWLINDPANNPAIEMSGWFSSWFLILVFTFLLTAGIRCSYRILRTFLHRPNHEHGKEQRRVMVIGAGKAGQAIIKEIQTTQGMNRKVVAVIDDNATKLGKYLEGVPVVGDCSTIVENAVRLDVQEIIFAIPSAQPSQRRRILEICNLTKCTLKALPGIYQMIDGEVGYKSLKDVSVEDLLARDPIKVDNDAVLEKMRGKTVLVTGGGGSIGSELCRQIAAHSPGELVIFDIFENGAYEIQQELRRRCPDLKLSVQIGSVRDEARMDQLFRTFRPAFVFHAAAHKHVPLMEDSPFEAIKNNVFGTLNTAKMADKYHAEQFLLISTDKAVNPTNIMGAPKRLCENVVRYMSMRSETKFVAVRFGNVLGSNGSVVPLFRRQIEEGGPVTVTDKNIIRYFMTIPEAVSLILQAHAFAKNGEIYVLDMGEPVKIDDMARKMIRLSGLEPDVDIK
ncbi:MAG: polysaccharide biosynthesis protein, partial [Oscillospiraceae bacterium]|nr:polysaccharide biosynthesis protein [Oscillospiraceae bacterium]